MCRRVFLSYSLISCVLHVEYSTSIGNFGVVSASRALLIYLPTFCLVPGIPTCYIPTCIPAILITCYTYNLLYLCIYLVLLAHIRLHLHALADYIHTVYNPVAYSGTHRYLHTYLATHHQFLPHFSPSNIPDACASFS